MNLLRCGGTPARDYVLVALAFISIVGRNSSGSKKVDPVARSRESVATTKESTGPDIDLNCVINHIQNPPESFHYAFKSVSDNPWEEQAEVTPQQIDGTFSNSSLPTPQPFHGAPREVPSNLMAIGRMASLFATVRNTSAMVNGGADEGVNATAPLSIRSTLHAVQRKSRRSIRAF